jgi:FkbM family methyltransferase
MTKSQKKLLSLKLKMLRLFSKKIYTIKIKIKNFSRPFRFRNDSVGDIGVIKQIFQNEDYNIFHFAQGKKLIEYHNEKSKNLPSLIIDAGANIGASSVYFSSIYENSFIFAIEPEINNFNLLSFNTLGLNVFNFNGAIDNKDGELFLEDPGLSDWGFRAQSTYKARNNLTKIKSISPNAILMHPLTKKTNPLILKIDIEGGEDSLFKGDVNWINKFPLIIIELHDWMLPFAGSSQNFIKAISKHDFDFVYRGENIFLFNRKILNN